MKKSKILFVFLLFVFTVDAFAGTGDAYGAKPIFDKINAALNDTYLSAILAVGGLWKGYDVHSETGNMKKAAPFAVVGLAIGSLGGAALAISGATF